MKCEGKIGSSRRTLAQPHTYSDSSTSFIHSEEIIVEEIVVGIITNQYHRNSSHSKGCRRGRGPRTSTWQDSYHLPNRWFRSSLCTDSSTRCQLLPSPST